MMIVRQLFMSNTKGKYLKLSLLMLAWFILLEIILRLPPVEARLERYAAQPVWYSPYVPQRIKIIRNNPDADIWFVGSSSVVVGINPDMIDPLVNKQTTDKHKSLNLGLLGMFYVDHLESYLNHAFLPVGTPKVVVLGAFPLMFAYSPKGYSENSAEYKATIDHSTELDRQVSGWLYDHFALYKLIHTFRYLIAETPSTEVYDTPTGYVNLNRPITNIVPATASGTTNDLLEKNLLLLKHLHDSLQARGIQLFFINMPMYDPEMQAYPGGLSNYQAYISRLTAFAVDEGIPFLDVWQALEDKQNQHLSNTDFMDFWHLNNNGANAISPLIADFLARNLDSVTK